MRKFKFFIKSLIPVILMFILQAVSAIPTIAIFLLRSAPADRGDFLTTLAALSSDREYLQTLNLVYGFLALLVFGIWYYRVFVRPFRNRPRKLPDGYSFHTIASIIFLGIGLQYVTTLLMDVLGSLSPELISRYNDEMAAQGYNQLSVLLLIYSVLLAPIVEELIFRGLVFRFARHAMPFWLANILQAALFGFVHLNLAQGIYAFAMGLFLGWICHRGQGIKYSVPVHIVFNIIGCLFSELIGMTLTLNFPLFAGLGILLTVFAMWLFYTDFQTAR